MAEVVSDARHGFDKSKLGVIKPALNNLVSPQEIILKPKDAYYWNEQNRMSLGVLRLEQHLY